MQSKPTSYSSFGKSRHLASDGGAGSSGPRRGKSRDPDRASASADGAGFRRRGLGLPSGRLARDPKPSESRRRSSEPPRGSRGSGGRGLEATPAGVSLGTLTGQALRRMEQGSAAEVSVSRPGDWLGTRSRQSPVDVPPSLRGVSGERQAATRGDPCRGSPGSVTGQVPRQIEAGSAVSVSVSPGKTEKKKKK